MTKSLEILNGFVWGAPALILILTVGLDLSLRLRFVQLRLLPEGLQQLTVQIFRKEKGSGVKALCTALAATVGTGNLVGVAGAICLGGPGAVFWMLLCGILGMMTKFAEALLAVRYRIPSEEGFLGGPMYVMERGLGRKWKPMAILYSLFGLIASFGVGNSAQVNAVVSGIHGVQVRFGGQISYRGDLLCGLVLAVVVGVFLFGGAKRISAAAERLVPFAAGGYILLCLGALAARAEAIPGAIADIVQGAFCPEAVTGGMLGSSFQALRIGCSRGVFTNEAGMGTAAIAHGSSDTADPVCQGMMGIVEVFLDTIVICTLTALVILTSGVQIGYGVDIGSELTTQAFVSVYGDAAAVFLSFSLILFAVATILGWGFYGACCCRYLFGPKVWSMYAVSQSIAVVFGAVADTRVVWQLSETVNGLMVIPNLITLAALSGEVVRLTKEYRKSGIHHAGGGNYADFHQCKPL